MMRLGVFLGAVAGSVLAIGSAAQAQIVPTTVTSIGSFGGSLAVLNDGVFPADGSFYQSPQTVDFGTGNYPRSVTASFTFDFGGLYSLSQLTAAVDNNDDYIFNFFNGASAAGSYTYLASFGNVTGGMQNFSTSFASAIQATRVVVTAANGDNLYSIGEVQLTGNAVTSNVPEPASWAMMVGGFGLLGAALRGRRRVSAFVA